MREGDVKEELVDELNSRFKGRVWWIIKPSTHMHDGKTFKQILDECLTVVYNNRRQEIKAT